jgi:ribosome modulation factor
MTAPMPREYTLAEADAHEAGWRQAMNDAIAAVAAFPLEAADQPYDGPFQRGQRNGWRAAMDRVGKALASLTPPARPSPTRLGVLGEG